MYASIYDLEAIPPNSTGGGRGGYTTSTNPGDPVTGAPGDCAIWSGNGRVIVGGLGGRPLQASSSKLYLGGGGGAGHDVTGGLGGNGGTGGGVVFIIANQISSGVAAPALITANGGVGLSVSSSIAGAGGGGGGGSIYIQLPDTAVSADFGPLITVAARGGNGGDVACSAGICTGAGGSGGGGAIYTNVPGLVGDVSGGSTGTVGAINFASFPPNGATQGCNGLQLPLSSPSASPSFSSTPTSTVSFSASTSNSVSTKPSTSVSAASTPSTTPSTTTSTTVSLSLLPSPSTSVSPTSISPLGSPSLSISAASSTSAPSHSQTTQQSISATASSASSPDGPRSSTPKPSKSSPTTVIVNPVCSDNDNVLCASGQCKSDHSECKGEPDISDEIEEVTYTVTTRDRNKSILLNIVGKDNKGVGQVLFPANMLQQGWNVTITSSDHPSTSSSDGDCGETQTLEQTSTSVDIAVTNSKGREVRKFDKSFQLSLYSLIDDKSLDDICFGYSNNRDDGWRCNNNIDLEKTSTMSVYLVNTKSDHLTSFAVLLGSTSGAGCEWGWIQIASLVILGSTIVFVLLTLALYQYSRVFRVLVTGHDEEEAIESIKKAQQSEREEAMKN